MMSVQFFHVLLKLGICPFAKSTCCHILAKDLIEAIMVPSTDTLLLKHRIV